MYMDEDAIYEYIAKASGANHNITTSAPHTDKGDDKTDAWGIV